ncbi:MAG: hypothetical protein ACPGVD_09210 [Flavobacteriales bacterium]
MANFTTPIGFISTSQTFPHADICLGRPFRQPVDLPDSNDYSKGLEFFRTSDSDIYLTAMFDGVLRFEQNRGELILSEEAQRAYNAIGNIREPSPKTVVYENITQEADSIAYLISNAFQNNPSHPILSLYYNWHGEEQALGEALNNMPSGYTINNYLNDYVITPVFGADEIPVLAGDLIAYMGATQPNDVVPSSCNFPPPGHDTRRTTVYIKNYAGQHINPSYYLWFLLKYNHENPNGSMRFLSTSGYQLLGNYFVDNHLLSSLNLNINTEQLPRIITNITLPGQTNNSDVLLFPMENLGEWHGVQGLADTAMNRYPPPLELELHSDILWRLNDISNDNISNGIFEVSARNINTVNPNIIFCPWTINNWENNHNVCPTPGNIHINRVTTFWNNHETDINDLTELIQVPSELLTGVIGVESNFDPNLVAFEPVRTQDEISLQNAGISDSLITQYRTWVGNGLYGITLPPINNLWTNNPINGTTNITWNQVKLIMDAIPGRFSTGYAHVLLSNAISLCNWLEERFDDVQNTFQVNTLPTQGSDAFEWMLSNPRHSFLVCLAHLKRDFIYLNSSYDLLKAGSIYNKGYDTHRNDFHYVVTDEYHWFVRFTSARHGRDLTRYYNAAITRFNVNNGAEATSRFWKTLQ